MAKKVCSVCGAKNKAFGDYLEIVTVKGVDYCTDCVQPIYDEISKIPVTTTPTLEGWVVKKYLGIESAEVVIGTGLFSEFLGEMSDVFGERSTPFEKKLQQAKSIAFAKLKRAAYEYDANAIIGVDMDYTEFSGNRIGVIINGTLVQVERISE